MHLFIVFLCSFLLSSAVSIAQFAPPAGQIGTTAISKDAINIKAWASQCTVVAGPTNIADTSALAASAGTASNATGQAGDGSIVSLGDGGYAIVEFDQAISNGPGADFAVFENAFNATFPELAFVEVSSDGLNYVRFPAISNTSTLQQIDAFGALDATQIYNLAGKYQANYGTPFDLEELIQDSAIVDLNAITHIKIIDVVGSIQANYCSRDSRGLPINDPWPTPFASSGFDLDAVAVLNQEGVGISNLYNSALRVYPNPSKIGHAIFIDNNTNFEHLGLALYSCTGQCVWHSNEPITSIPTAGLKAGFYQLRIDTKQGILSHKIILQP